MAAPRTSSEIIKGSKIMVFYNNEPIGFATSHSLSMTTNTTQVSSKDHGDFPATLPQNITWEITCENLYSDAGEETYMEIMKGMTPVTIVFAKSNYDNTDAQGSIVDDDNASNWTISSKIAEGKALISSFSINAPAGDNATMSVTFTGSGELKTDFS